jgi:hypothetical protein
MDAAAAGHAVACKRIQQREQQQGGGRGLHRSFKKQLEAATAAETACRSWKGSSQDWAMVACRSSTGRLQEPAMVVCRQSQRLLATRSSRCKSAQQ